MVDNGKRGEVMQLGPEARRVGTARLKNSPSRCGPWPAGALGGTQHWRRHTAENDAQILQN